MTLICDDVSNGKALADFTLLAEFAQLKKERDGLLGQSSVQASLRLLTIGVRIRAIMRSLGRPQADPNATAPQAPSQPGTPPTKTDAFYPDEGKRTKGQRQKDNDAAIALLKQIQAGSVAVTDTERAILAKYSGNGGGLVDTNGLSGSPYEYYTPKPIAKAMWDLLGELGFVGGKVLDPCSGTGVFTATRPDSAVMTQVELDATSGAINAAINDGATVNTTVSPFEAHASSTPDNLYDAVVTNVPFGDLAMRGSNPQLDKRFQRANLQEYFILRCLQKLKPRGLAAFIVPKSIVSGLSSKERKLRQSASMMAEFVGAYRLPNSIFHTAAADVTTDLIVFRKYADDVAQKIDELQAQQPQLLSEANVLWEPFISGTYFTTVGVPYILGEHGTTQGKFGEVAAVINNDSVSNIAKLIKRFPASPIDWALLDATETAAIAYKDGDVMHANGQTLQYKEGQWEALAAGGEEDASMQALGLKLQTPLGCVNHQLSWQEVATWLDYESSQGRYRSVPAWLFSTQAALKLVNAQHTQMWWQAIIAGMSVMWLMQAARPGEAENYQARYPILSQLLVTVQSYANKSIGQAAKTIKESLQCIRNARFKGEFTPFWCGTIQASVEAAPLTPTQLYERAKYEAEDESGYVTLDKMRAAFSGFDPLESNEWCIAADGKTVIHANDYYIGNYADFLVRAKAELDACEVPELRAKLLRQHAAAKERLNPVDVSKMSFNLFTPYVSMQQKLQFLKQYVSQEIFLTTDAMGREVFDIKADSLPRWGNTTNNKALVRFVKGYLRNQSITTMTRSDEVALDPAKEAALVRRISAMADAARAQFDAWARANDEVQAALHSKLNAAGALRFIEEADGSPLDIPGLNAIGANAFRPHPYQYGAVRRFSRNFGGILGFDVGLGKTITALAATQYVQSIGVKHKSVFVVPNSTLTNWKKESQKAYLDTSDCLYVGLVTGRNGKQKIDTNQVKIDLNRIRENQHSKIFMTLEAFKMIPLREETMQGYLHYLGQNDDAYLLAEEDALKKKAHLAQQAKTLGARALGDKSAAITFFEDMGIDSLILDEAHNYKNSKVTSSQFKSAKFLADSSKSQRGMDMQAKAWYIRGLSTRNDGVLALTATPVTNSPLEVYSMLTLALGERQVNEMYGVTGADSFMDAACDIEEREEESIVGNVRMVRTFVGLQNASLLRRLLTTTTLIKTADDVKADGLDIAIPDASEVATQVDLGPDSMWRLLACKNDYSEAAKAVMDGHASPEEKLTASPFNLIRKMTRIINDPELEEGVLRFAFSESQAGAFHKAMEAFNQKAIVEERDHEDPNAAPGDTKTKVCKDTETGETTLKYLITVRCRLSTNAEKHDNTLELLSVNYETQEVLLTLLEKNGVTPTVTVSPKLAAVIANVKLEAASPRHMGQAKQIIFCDELSLHHKIRLALIEQCGIPSAKIRILNAKSVDTAGMQAVQDGYNADGEDNQFTIIIANKKAEVGINLQKGTQAIHHMTIGWTPDSIHQRNGRGVRQGNPLDTVTVYHYDAQGTFDAYKRKLVGVKASWINSLMAGDSSKIAIEGDMSRADVELLASAVGDAGAMSRINDAIATKAAREKRKASQVSQIQSLRIIQAQDKWLKQYGLDTIDAYQEWTKQKVHALTQTMHQIDRLESRLEKTTSESLKERMQADLAEQRKLKQKQWAALGGLQTDYRGMPVPVSYGVDLKSADTMATTAFQNWQKDVNATKRMQQEAVSGYMVRAQDGYSADDLAAFNADQAEIIAGQLAVVGGIAKIDGKLWAITRSEGSSKSLVGIDPSTLTETTLERMPAPTLLARGAPEWAAVVQQAVEIDEQTIANQTTGFGKNSRNLYASYVSDVREALRVPIPSNQMAITSFQFKKPYFPFALPENAQGGALIDKIKAEQAPLITRYIGGDWVNLADVRCLGEGDAHGQQAWIEGLAEYCGAYQIRATKADLAAMPVSWYPFAILQGLGVIYALRNAIFEGVAQSTSPEALDQWALAWLQSNQQVIQIEPEDFDAALGTYYGDYIRVRMSIDDGKVRWTTLNNETYRYLSAPISTAITDAIEQGFLAEYLKSTRSQRFMPTDFFEQVGADLIKVVFAEQEDHLELIAGLDEARAQMGISANYRLYVEGNDSMRLIRIALRSHWAEMQASHARFQTKQIAQSSGIDLEGILNQLNNLAGIQSARIGDGDVNKLRDKYSGQYLYRSGRYILLQTVSGSSTHKKIATAGQAGLQGRTFDRNTNAFRICIDEGEQFDNGQPVASLQSLFDHLGLSMKDDTL